MKTLVVGATGATGRLLVKELLDRGLQVKVIVRSPEKLSSTTKNHSNLSMTHASLLDLDDDTLTRYVAGCDAIASCLGHNVTLRGIFGPPHKLVTDATRRLCHAVRANDPDHCVKFVLMNSAGNTNPNLGEEISFAHRGLLWLIRLLLPPHVDNEQAADYLRIKVGQNDPIIKWVVIRPDSLIDENEVRAYEAYASPIRSALLDPGKTSRINVAHFMADMITNQNVWNKWQGQMPVIYDQE